MDDLTSGNKKLNTKIARLKKIIKKYQHAHNMQHALIQLSEQASNVPELTLLYPAIHKILEAYLPSSNFYVVLENQLTHTLELTYFSDEKDDKSVPLAEEHHFNEGLTGYVFKTGKTQLFTQADILSGHKQDKFKVLGTVCEHWLGVPIFQDKEIMGVMVSQSYHANALFNQSHVELFEVISLYLSTAIERVKKRELLELEVKYRTYALTQSNQALQNEIGQRKQALDRLQILFKISRLATKTEHLSDFYQQIHHILQSITYAENIYICLYDKEAKQLSFPYAVDERISTYRTRPYQKGFTEYVITQRCAQLIDNKRAEELIAQGDIVRTENHSTNSSETSWIGAPLISEGNVIGVIACQSYDHKHTYNADDVELINFVSQQIANVLQKHLANQALKQSHEKLEKRVKDKTKALQQSNLHLQLQIEERKKIEQQLYHDAHHDALTGLANRSLFLMQLDKQLQQNIRHPQHGFAVLFIDLDNFKAINDNLGHQAGDEFLVEVAQSFSYCIREHDLLARLAGDEFVILLNHLHHPQEAIDVANRIIEIMRVPFCRDGFCIESGASVGITHSHNNYQHTDEIIRDADTAMYQAKKNGRGQCEFFHPLLRQLDMNSGTITQINDTLQPQDLHFNGKAIIAIHNGETQACLVERFWLHPNLGKIQFSQIEKYLSDTQQLIECELNLLTSVLTQNNTLQPILLNCNINMLNVGHFAALKRTLMAHLGSSVLCLLFNEEAISRADNQQIQHLNQLQEMGIQIGLNDFAKYRCDLNIVTRCQFDYIVLSPIFSQRLLQQTSHQLQLQGLLAITNSCNSQVIAKGPAILNYQVLLEKHGIALFSSQQDFSASLPDMSESTLIASIR